MSYALTEQDWTTAQTARDLISSGSCSPSCLLALSPFGSECNCKCGGKYHGRLTDAEVALSLQTFLNESRAQLLQELIIGDLLGHANDLGAASVALIERFWQTQPEDVCNGCGKLRSVIHCGDCYGPHRGAGYCRSCAPGHLRGEVTWQYCVDRPRLAP